MKRNYIIIAVSITMFLLLVASGLIIYNRITQNNEIQEGKIKEYENKISEETIESNIDIVETTSKEEKVSPNCIFIFKTLFHKCEHLKVEKEQISESMVNKTREDLEKIYKGWKIITFRNDEVLFYKEEDGICDEHYLLKDLDGNIAIYIVDDEEGIEILKEKTSIVVDYLAEEDKEKLKDGIRVDTKEKLNRTLEDYE